MAIHTTERDAKTGGNWSLDTIDERGKKQSNVDFDEMKESFLNRGLDEQSAEDQAYSIILLKLKKKWKMFIFNVVCE